MKVIVMISNPCLLIYAGGLHGVKFKLKYISYILQVLILY